MFNYIKIEGFRGFKQVELDLSPLSVLIGPNGAGKSNLLDLLMLMSEAGNGQLANGVYKRGGFRDIAFGFDPSQEVSVEVRFAKGVRPIWLFNPPSEEESNKRERDLRFKIAMRSFGVSQFQISDELVREESSTEPSLSIDVVSRNISRVVFRRRGDSGAIDEEPKSAQMNELAIFQVRDASKYPAAAAVLQELQEWAFYRDIGVGPESPVREPAVLRRGSRLLPDGGNLSSFLYSIQQDQPDTWDEILEICRTAYPDFRTLTIPAGGGDGKVIVRWWEKHHERKGGLSANLLSDGTLKLLCLIAILKSPFPPPLICIDEPELGLHPDWIKLVAEMMQSAAARTQLIVATHSPHIVARLEPEQVIVAEKENGETRLRRLQTQELGKWLNEFNLSDLWLAGHLGGRP